MPELIQSAYVKLWKSEWKHEQTCIDLMMIIVCINSALTVNVLHHPGEVTQDDHLSDVRTAFKKIPSDLGLEGEERFQILQQ